MKVLRVRRHYREYPWATPLYFLLRRVGLHWAFHRVWMTRIAIYEVWDGETWGKL